MKRAEKRVLSAIMEKPRSFDDLCQSLRLPIGAVEKALNVLIKDGSIQYGDGGKYFIRKQKDRSILKAKVLEAPSRSLPESPDELLEEAVSIRDKPIPDWLKNPPQPLPRRLREPKTRRRDR